MSSSFRVLTFRSNLRLIPCFLVGLSNFLLHGTELFKASFFWWILACFHQLTHVPQFFCVSVLLYISSLSYHWGNSTGTVNEPKQVPFKLLFILNSTDKSSHGFKYCVSDKQTIFIFSRFQLCRCFTFFLVLFDYDFNGWFLMSGYYLIIKLKLIFNETSIIRWFFSL